MDAKTDGRAAHAPRVEDDVLVRGNGRYAADVPLPQQAYAYFVRSPHAFARIVSVDVSAAQSAPGVLGVLTATDMESVGSLARHPPLAGRGGKGLIVPHRPALAGERVMHIGEPVAMVVAENAAAAQDAAETVAVEYEPLTPVIDARQALAAGAPLVWQEAPGNLAVDWPGPAQDAEANARHVDEIFAAAKFVARIAVMNQRMVVASMEPRGATASYDAATESYTLRVCSQGTTAMRDSVAAILQVPKERLRVLTDDVGGAFGLKAGPYPEYIAQMIGAKKLGRPIHWMSGRSEAFLSDNQARDIHSEAELALDDNGTLPGAARPQHRQSRRLYRSRGRQHSDLKFCPLSAGSVRHQTYRHQRALRLYQYDHDGALSRRRPAGSELRARARGRGSRAGDGDRSGEAAAAQSRSKVRHALQNRRRHDL